MNQFPSQQNTPMDPREQANPLNDMGQQTTPMNPGAPQEPMSTPMPGQPLESQGMPAGQQPGMGQPVSEEETAELRNLLEATRDKFAELQSAKFRTENQREVARVETLREILIAMQDVGVDLNDPMSVADFLQKTREASPEMAKRFEEVLEDLLSDDPVGPAQDAQQMGMPQQNLAEGPQPQTVGPDQKFGPAPGMKNPQGAPAQDPLAQGLPPIPQTGNETLPEEVRGPIQG